MNGQTTIKKVKVVYGELALQECIKNLIATKSEVNKK